jgi:hypothetical protein
MDDFIERQNILHFTDMLKAETDPEKRAMLLRLLAEEEMKRRLPRSKPPADEPASGNEPLRAWGLPR